MKSHYDTLGVSPTATVDEIKQAYRKLCMETHPDVSAGSCDEKFKQISEAHSVLTNRKQRQLYDLERNSSVWPPRGSRSARQSNNPSHGFRGGRPASSASMDPYSMFVEGFFRPRNVMIGMVLGYCTITALQKAFLDDSAKKDKHLVEAWKNPETGSWEQPAPWDATYQKTKPKLFMIPREQVRPRN